MARDGIPAVARTGCSFSEERISCYILQDDMDMLELGSLHEQLNDTEEKLFEIDNEVEMDLLEKLSMSTEESGYFGSEDLS